MNATATLPLPTDTAAADLRTEALGTINAAEKFLDRTLRCLEERDSLFRATPQTMTVASQVAHAAQVIDWFREGALHDRWNMDFPAQVAVTDAAASLGESKEWLAAAFARLRQELATTTSVALAEPMADNPILQTRPRYHLVFALADHCGHHRGALAVYARLLGREPLMPYGED